MSTRAAIVVAILSIFGAHGLVYLLIGVLPDPATIFFGVESVRQEVMAAFHAAHEIRPYTRVLADLARLDLGTTLDGVSVVHDLRNALSATLPRLTMAFIAIGLVCILTALFSRPVGKSLDRTTTFVAFLPPYVVPFIALLALLTGQSLWGVPFTEAVTPAATVVAIATAPAALISAQTASIMRRNLESDFGRTLIAVGARPLYQRFRLLHNVAAEIAPSFEKVMTSLVAALLFAEPILGLSGFGTTAIRAVRRSDPDLLLGVTLVIAVAIGFMRISALCVRRYYGLRL